MKKFIYGIARLTFNGIVIGWIEKGSFDWGGSKGEKVDVEAEQVPNTPVLTLVTKNGTLSPTFNSYSWTTKVLNRLLVVHLSDLKKHLRDGKHPQILLNFEVRAFLTLCQGRLGQLPTLC